MIAAYICKSKPLEYVVVSICHGPTVNDFQ